MSRYRLGINTCFGVKRWPEPEAWASIVRDQLGLDLVQHSLDLVALDVPPATLLAQAAGARDACGRYGLDLHSTFTGLAAYSYNLLLHPNEAMRDAAEAWFIRAIDFTAEAGGRATGGHIGAYSAATWEDAGRRAQLAGDLGHRLARLTHTARERGLERFLIENMAAYREPSTMDVVEALLSDGDETHVPIALCLDVGHQCVFGTEGEERDPYAWLRRLGARSAAIHLQQTDEQADHHWPFTPEYNARGRITADGILDALDASGTEDTVLLLEVIPPFEANDEDVLRDLEQSVAYWREALKGRTG